MDLKLIERCYVGGERLPRNISVFKHIKPGKIFSVDSQIWEHLVPGVVKLRTW